MCAWFTWSSNGGRSGVIFIISGAGDTEGVDTLMVRAEYEWHAGVTHIEEPEKGVVQGSGEAPENI